VGTLKAGTVYAHLMNCPRSMFSSSYKVTNNTDSSNVTHVRIRQGLTRASLRRSAHRRVNLRSEWPWTLFAFKVMTFVQVLTVVAFFVVSIASDTSRAHLPFNPREYPKKVVSCPAINRAENTRVGIELRTRRLHSCR